MHHPKGFCLLAVAVLLLASVPALPAATHFPALVIDVAAGDVITVLTKNKLQIKIRLYGIDCPDKGQDFGESARQATYDAVYDKTVSVQALGTDRYGRVVAVVLMPGGSSLSEHLVRNGLAWVYAQHCKRANICMPLWHLQIEAKRYKLGIWQDKSPVPPWDWRKKKKQQSTIV